MKALLFAGADWTDRHQRICMAALLAVVLLVSSLAASAREVAFFPGNAKLSAVSLYDEKCKGGTDSFRAIVHALNRFTKQEMQLEACWYYSDMGGTLTSKDVISTCVRADGTLRTQVSFDCTYVDKRYFIDPRTLPKRAFQ